MEITHTPIWIGVFDQIQCLKIQVPSEGIWDQTPIPKNIGFLDFFQIQKSNPYNYDQIKKSRRVAIASLRPTCFAAGKKCWKRIHKMMDSESQRKEEEQLQEGAGLEAM